MAGSLGVVVRNRTGNTPLENVKITINGPQKCSDTGNTNAQGIKTFENILEGDYTITAELGGFFIAKATATVTTGSVSVNILLDKVKYLYFAIYYTAADNAFKRAADTWKAEIQPKMDKGNDTVQMIEVKSEGEFKTAWETLLKEGNKSGWKVAEGRIFSHASKGDKQDGLEFMGGGGEDGTVSQKEMISLAKLNWSATGRLVLHGCNTGLSGGRGWTPAGAFAKTQGVPTTGQTGYAYFSRQWTTYDEIDATCTGIYLWAYSRGKNGALGSGARMEGAVFKP
ncbi:MAG: carboxypeptidase regulatory-like domain-containing protein [Acidobacteria bacterium]|nr:carboxypeptidase regulatory-like domain-containing protein [Acidobacteriota bacterium]